MHERSDAPGAGADPSTRRSGGDPATDVARAGENESDRARAGDSAVRDGLAVGLATAVYGISFGALAVAAGLDVWQTCFLSLVMFTGGSQFALVGVLASGGVAAGGSAIATAAMLGIRNVIYGMRMKPILEVSRRRVGRPRCGAGSPQRGSRSTSRPPSRSRSPTTAPPASGSGSPASSSSSAGTSRRSRARSSATPWATRGPGGSTPPRRRRSSGCSGRD